MNRVLNTEKIINDFYNGTLRNYIMPRVLYSGINDKGQNVLVQLGEDFLKIATMQSNGYFRTNIYYKNGDSEEVYEK